MTNFERQIRRNEFTHAYYSQAAPVFPQEIAVFLFSTYNCRLIFLPIQHLFFYFSCFISSHTTVAFISPRERLSFISLKRKAEFYSSMTTAVFIFSETSTVFCQLSQENHCFLFVPADGCFFILPETTTMFNFCSDNDWFSFSGNIVMLLFSRKPFTYLQTITVLPSSRTSSVVFPFLPR